MSETFTFRKPGRLVDGDLSLVLTKKSPADPAKGHVPAYVFTMRQVGTRRRMGRISFRVGSARKLRYPGHIGYGVLKRYRGHRYAARACKLLFDLAADHGLKALWITCKPDNKASRRTLEVIGGRYVETVRIPKPHEMYRRDYRYVRRYRIALKR
ncbi:MAG: GNAT family N-acetyltransferase [Phycisphaerae bacterium]|jgi:tagatose 1,6-diphosphate aldolase|nr:GNAT family N-acetyltransferase [Phycisphaerae bacterium]